MKNQLTFPGVVILSTTVVILAMGITALGGRMLGFDPYGYGPTPTELQRF